MGDGYYLFMFDIEKSLRDFCFQFRREVRKTLIKLRIYGKYVDVEIFLNMNFHMLVFGRLKTENDRVMFNLEE